MTKDPGMFFHALQRPARLMLAMMVAAAFVVLAAKATADADPRRALAAELAAIDREMPGNFGVYLKWLGDGREVKHEADRAWYLASTTKVPLAVAVMKQVEAGALTLDQELELAESDYVDGLGALLWAEPGSKFTIGELIRNSIEDSDSTSTDMLVRLLGEEVFNGQLAGIVGAGEFGPITTILRVRYGAYGEIHPDASRLSNMDIMDVQTAGGYPERYAKLLEKLGISPEEAVVSSIPEAFKRYYDSGENSGSLTGMGALLEGLAEGELLNAEHTALLLEYMQNVTTGDRRIKAGLPDGAAFAHKTGTQVNRACHIGILDPETPARAVVVAACAEGYGDLRQAEQAFERVGRLLRDTAAPVTD
jgi:beta-lactamase class A